MTKNELITALYMLGFKKWYQKNCYITGNNTQKPKFKAIYVDLVRYPNDKRIKGCIGASKKPNITTSVHFIPEPYYETPYKSYTRILREIQKLMKSQHDSG